MSVAVEYRAESSILNNADGQPAGARGPLGVDRPRGVAVRGVKVQRAGQFVAVAGAVTDRSRKGVGVDDPGIAIGPAVAVQVVADGV